MAAEDQVPQTIETEKLDDEPTHVETAPTQQLGALPPCSASVIEDKHMQDAEELSMGRPSGAIEATDAALQAPTTETTKVIALPPVCAPSTTGATTQAEDHTLTGEMQLPLVETADYHGAANLNVTLLEMAPRSECDDPLNAETAPDLHHVESQGLEVADVAVADAFAQDNDAAIAEAAAPAFSVGERVLVSKPSKETISGRVAVVGLLSLLVATDKGEWITIELPEQLSFVSHEKSPPNGRKSVVAFSYNQQSKGVTGMFFGKESEMLFNGAMHAYMAHVARPVDRDSRLRELDNRLGTQSFALGDVVEQVGGDVRPPAHAAVVRVCYSARNVKQSRKLLVLIELPTASAPYKLPAGDLLFFPASWSNWKPIQGAGTVTLGTSDIKTLEKVTHTLMHGHATHCQHAKRSLPL